MPEAVPELAERGPPAAAPRLVGPTAEIGETRSAGSAAARPRWYGDGGSWRRAPTPSQGIDHAHIHPAWGTAL